RDVRKAVGRDHPGTTARMDDLLGIVHGVFPVCAGSDTLPTNLASREAAGNGLNGPESRARPCPALRNAVTTSLQSRASDADHRGAGVARDPPATDLP